MEGWTSPSENWRYWYRFFRRTPQYVSLHDADPKSLRGLRQSMAAFIKVCWRPILIKNLSCGLRLLPTHEALPESLYIVVRRNVPAVAQSLLAGRLKLNGSYDKWLSLEPSNIDELKSLRPHEQVVEQVLAIYRQIDEDSERIGRDRFLSIEYENLCRDPHATMELVREFLLQNQVLPDGRYELPTEFDLPPSPPLDSKISSELIQYCQTALASQSLSPNN